MLTLTREAIIKTLKDALEPFNYIHAMWEGGAAAWGRIDEWSDIDIQLDVDDNRVTDTVLAVETALQHLTAIQLRYEIPQPTWHGHWQAFYILEDANPFLALDLAIMKHSSHNKFLEAPIHGKAVVHFDKSNVTAAETNPFKAEPYLTQIKARLEVLPVVFEIFQSLTLKEFNRGNTIEAMSYYHSFTLRPLVEVLRIKFNPIHYNFHTRYVHYELPEEIVKRLEPLYFAASGDDLRKKHEQAEHFFNEVLKSISVEEIKRKLRHAVDSMDE
jgi:hypothetical protein